MTSNFSLLWNAFGSFTNKHVIGLLSSCNKNENRQERWVSMSSTGVRPVATGTFLEIVCYRCFFVLVLLHRGIL